MSPLLSPPATQTYVRARIRTQVCRQRCLAHAHACAHMNTRAHTRTRALASIRTTNTTVPVLLPTCRTTLAAAARGTYTFSDEPAYVTPALAQDFEPSLDHYGFMRTLPLPTMARPSSHSFRLIFHLKFSFNEVVSVPRRVDRSSIRIR